LSGLARGIFASFVQLTQGREETKFLERLREAGAAEILRNSSILHPILTAS
jgi:hypothetical protein